MKKAIFSEKQPDYRYFPLADGHADVFIYEYIGEVTTANEMDDSSSVGYEYKVNEFRTLQSQITEDMVKSNPLKYLDYEMTSLPTDHERLEAIEKAFIELVNEVI